VCHQNPPAQTQFVVQPIVFHPLPVATPLAA
jgi:hypothetical protein